MKKTGMITVLISTFLFLGIGAVQFAPILLGEAVFNFEEPEEHIRGEYHTENIHVYLSEEDITWDDKTRLLWAIAKYVPTWGEERTVYVSDVRRNYEKDEYIVHLTWDSGYEQDLALSEDSVEYED